MLGMLTAQTPTGKSLWAEHGTDDLIRLAMMVRRGEGERDGGGGLGFADV